MGILNVFRRGPSARPRGGDVRAHGDAATFDGLDDPHLAQFMRAGAATQAGVVVEDRLFATLDPTTRRLALPGGEPVLLTDMVGVTECISSTPKIVSAISNPVAEAKPGRLRRITECMTSTIARHTP